MLKAIERVAKTMLALVVGALLWVPRSWRQALPTAHTRARILIVRIDARVGEALLTTPLPEAIARERPGWEVTLLVHPRCVSMVMGAPGVARVLPFARKRLWMGASAPEIRALRKEAFDVVIDASNWTAPSVTSAIVSRLIANSAAAFGAPVAAVVGPSNPFLNALRDYPITPRTDTRSEVRQRLHLLSPLLGTVPDAPMAFRAMTAIDKGSELQHITSVPFAVVNPGGRLGWRRVPPEVFAAAARKLLRASLAVLVTWGPGEEALAQEVVRLAPGALLAPRTSLDALAWLMAHAQLAVCNNTGPMHLAVAAGTPTLGLFLRMEVERWGHPEAPHQMIDLTPAMDSGAQSMQRAELQTEAAVQTLIEHTVSRGETALEERGS